jgi:hypothetical protein
VTTFVEEDGDTQIIHHRERWTNELRLVYADGRTLKLTETPAKVEGDADAECTPETRVADQIRQRLCGFTAQDLKKHDLLRVATATDAAEIVAEIDSVLRIRETGAPADTEQNPSVENILAHMSAYMEAPAAV